MSDAGSAGPLEHASAAVFRGRLVVFPTDTVYGIGTRPDDPSATGRLFEAKARPPELQLSVLVPSAAAAREIARFDQRADALVVRFWSGPLTIVLPRTDRSSTWDLGGDPQTIGVRMPNHPLAMALLALTGPLATTSANRSGDPTPDGCDGIEDVFGERVDVYLCEQAPRPGRASTVVDLAHGDLSVLRSGSVTELDVLTALAEGGPAGGRV